VTHPAIAQYLLALLCGIQGLATLAIDLRRTHATNPEWTRHARYHVVWQAIGTALGSFPAMALVLSPGPLQADRFYLAALLAGLPMLGFLGALAGRRLYGGALSDPNGIPPVRIAAFGSVLHIDLNLVAEVLALSLLVGTVALFGN